MKKIISVLLVISILFSFSVTAFAGGETENKTPDSISDIDLEAAKDTFVKTLLEFASKLNSTAREELEKVLTNQLIQELASKSGLSEETVKLIVETAMSIAKVDGLLHIDAEKAEKFADFIFTYFGEYISDENQALVKVYLWLAGDQFGAWLDDMLEKYNKGETDPEEPDTPSEEDPSDSDIANSVEKFFAYVKNLFEKAYFFIVDLIGRIIPLFKPVVPEA